MLKVGWTLFKQVTLGQEEVDEVITRDIHRTFPEHPQFGFAQGQQALFRVLKAYSLHDLEVGTSLCTRTQIGDPGQCLMSKLGQVPWGEGKYRSCSRLGPKNIGVMLSQLGLGHLQCGRFANQALLSGAGVVLPGHGVCGGRRAHVPARGARLPGVQQQRREYPRGEVGRIQREQCQRIAYVLMRCVCLGAGTDAADGAGRPRPAGAVPAGPGGPQAAPALLRVAHDPHHAPHPGPPGGATLSRSALGTCHPFKERLAIWVVYSTQHRRFSSTTSAAGGPPGTTRPVWRGSILHLSRSDIPCCCGRSTRRCRCCTRASGS